MSGGGYVDPRCEEKTRRSLARGRCLILHVSDCDCGKFAGILAPESTSARVARETAGAFDDLRDLLSPEGEAKRTPGAGRPTRPPTPTASRSCLPGRSVSG